MEFQTNKTQTKLCYKELSLLFLNKANRFPITNLTKYNKKVNKIRSSKTLTICFTFYTIIENLLRGILFIRQLSDDFEFSRETNRQKNNINNNNNNNFVAKKKRAKDMIVLTGLNL